MAKRHQNQVGSLESLFLRMEELVLANSGEDEFEEVFKLLIAKLWDERSQQDSFHRYSTDVATYQAVVKLMHQADTEWVGLLTETKPRLTPEHLTVCVDALSKHNISSNSLEVIDSFFEFIVSKSAKGAKGQYFTPRHVIELCVRILQPTSRETVLDPACGSGGFLLHVLKYVKEQQSMQSLDKIQKFCHEKLWGFDIDSRVIRVAKALMLLAGDGNTNLIRLNSLLKPETIKIVQENSISSLTIEDVCRSRMKRHKGFDIILTNPPFAGEVREKSLLSQYSLSNSRPKVERDILFVERCLGLLKPGGRMAIILPHNKFAGNSFRTFREWLFQKARVLAVVGLGRNTFLPHTHQKASILFIQKKHTDIEKSFNYNIMFAVSEKDGKNSKGQIVFNKYHKKMDDPWLTVDHDFSEIVEGFYAFCTKENINFTNKALKA